MDPKALIIYNWTAGKGLAEKKLPLVRALLDQAGFEYDLVTTPAPGDATLLARQAAEAGVKRVVAAGGDGTVNEVVNGLMQANLNGNGRPTLGVLPVGRGNDFAFGVGIPLETAAAVKTLTQNQHRMIDLGHFVGGDYPQGRYFANGVGLGFDTVVGFEAAKIKRLQGAASYLVAVVRTIFLYSRAPIYEIEMDGETIRQPFLMVSIMNGRRMGGMFYMAPDSDPTDALLDLCLAGEVSQIRILPLAVKFFSGRQAEHAAVRMARAKNITVKAIEGTIPAHADGETICTAGRELKIEMVPNALQVFTGLNGASA
ncbi:MAG TPA: diacylglycerol kinase family protein [Bellilinea sp.]|nr:diacylglycerol kinase family protein [Bellilinea sp.]